MKKNLLWLGALLSIALAAGCSKTQEPAPAPQKGAKPFAAAKDLPPPMPGATPFKMEPHQAPDPAVLKKAIDEQRARDEKEAKEKGGHSLKAPLTESTPTKEAKPSVNKSEKTGKSS